jgi:peptidoglycan/xylan/chitin deacetylase (PgdA/CDA1 family)
VRGTKTARQAARWLRSRWGQQLMILGYHRVGDVTQDAYGITLQPRHFAEQMAVLRRVAHPCALAEGFTALQEGRLPARAVAVTFDDGYTDVACQALPGLAQQGIPATVFVIAGCLGQEPWWDELARIVLCAPALPLQFRLQLDGATLEWSGTRSTAGKPDQSAERQRLLSWLYRELATLPSVREQALAKLRSLWGGEQPAVQERSKNSIMSPQQLAALAGEELITIGSHTITHQALGTLNAEAQAAEIGYSKALLEAVIKSAVTAFSYPHGSIGKATAGFVREAGYAMACTSSNDLASRTSDPLLLPRFWPGDWDGVAFERRLRRWLHG